MQSTACVVHKVFIILILKDFLDGSGGCDESTSAHMYLSNKSL